MAHERESERSHELLDQFIERFWADQDEGRVLPLIEYMQMYPAAAEEVAAEYLAISGSRAQSYTDRYEIERRLGAGGEAEVFLARELSLDRLVALKIIRFQEEGRGGAAHRIEREGGIVSRLDYPGICPVYDVGRDDEHAFIAMRFIDGVPFDTFARGLLAVDVSEVPRLRRRTDLDELVRVVEEVAGALYYAHLSRVLHCDVKPSNILVDERGRPHLIDFGMARMDEDAQGLLAPAVGGTRQYMSPEQLTPDVVLDGRTDVYSLGLVLHEALTGCVAFTRDLDEGALSERVLHGDFPPIRKLNPAVPKDLAAIVAKATQAQRSQRYADAHAFGMDLRRFRERRPVEAAAPGRLSRWSRFVARNAVLSGLVAVILVVLTVGLIVVVRDRDRIERQNESLLDRERQVVLLTNSVTLPELRATYDSRLTAHERDEATRRWWIETVEGLLAQRGVYERAYRGVKHRAIAVQSSESPELAAREDDLVAWRDRIEASRTEANELTPAAREELARVLEEIEKARAERRQAEREEQCVFEDDLDRLAHDRLLALLNGIRWCESRLEEVRRLDARSRALAERTKGAFLAANDELRVRLQSSYQGERLESQFGLIPIGVDPESELLEFLHLESHVGPLPSRSPNGRIEMSDETGLIFVLVPRATFDMGAQGEDPEGPNHDPMARGDEGPVHRVSLDWFFVSKFELTQGQWRRLGGTSACAFPDGETLPVESVSWGESRDLLRRYGLDLPTEAQWEYAARAGSSAAWVTGFDREALADHANFADRESATRWGWPVREGAPLRSDPFGPTAPVDAQLSNRFGLYAVHGNVWEWCRDRFAAYDRPLRPANGLRRGGLGSSRVVRGGSFFDLPERMRFATRSDHMPDERLKFVGLRPVRAVE